MWQFDLHLGHVLLRWITMERWCRAMTVENYHVLFRWMQRNKKRWFARFTHILLSTILKRFESDFTSLPICPSLLPLLSWLEVCIKKKIFDLQYGFLMRNRIDSWLVWILNCLTVYYVLLSLLNEQLNAIKKVVGILYYKSWEEQSCSMAERVAYV